jgi:hypothetical protein
MTLFNELRISLSLARSRDLLAFTADGMEYLQQMLPEYKRNQSSTQP